MIQRVAYDQIGIGEIGQELLEVLLRVNRKADRGWIQGQPITESKVVPATVRPVEEVSAIDLVQHVEETRQAGTIDGRLPGTLGLPPDEGDEGAFGVSMDRFNDGRTLVFQACPEGVEGRGIAAP